jgi:hypothetical protein
MSWATLESATRTGVVVESARQPWLIELPTLRTTVGETVTWVEEVAVVDCVDAVVELETLVDIESRHYEAAGTSWLEEVFDVTAALDETVGRMVTE